MKKKQKKPLNVKEDIKEIFDRYPKFSKALAEL